MIKPHFTSSVVRRVAFANSGITVSSSRSFCLASSKALKKYYGWGSCTILYSMFLDVLQTLPWKKKVTSTEANTFVTSFHPMVLTYQVLVRIATRWVDCSHSISLPFLTRLDKPLATTAFFKPGRRKDTLQGIFLIYSFVYVISLCNSLRWIDQRSVDNVCKNYYVTRE